MFWICRDTIRVMEVQEDRKAVIRRLAEAESKREEYRNRGAGSAPEIIIQMLNEEVTHLRGIIRQLDRAATVGV